MSLAGQYRSPEDAVLMTVQYNRSEYQNDWNEYSLAATSFVGNSQKPRRTTRRPHALGTAPAGTPAYEFDSRGVFM